jgi:hypothetical protein
METDFEFNERQIALMVDTIALFKERRIGFFRLTNNLIGLLHAMKGVDLRWKDEFLKQWSGLDEIIAFSDRDPRDLDFGHSDEVKTITDNILKLIELYRGQTI